MELTPENAKKFTTLHPRCGTSFLFIVMIVAIIIFSCIDFVVPTPETLWGKLVLKLFLRVGLMPVIASLSYELQRYSSKHLNNFLFVYSLFPDFLCKELRHRNRICHSWKLLLLQLKYLWERKWKMLQKYWNRVYIIEEDLAK